MELSPHVAGLLLGLGFIFGLCMLGYGAHLGWNAAIRRFQGESKAMAAQMSKLDEVAERDPARYGIDLGKQYTIQKMRDTIDGIEREID